MPDRTLRRTASPPVEVSLLHDLGDLQQAAALLDRVWHSTGVMSAHLLRAIAHAGGYVAGAWAETPSRRLVGASAGFLGMEGAPDGGHRPTLHSHITGVLPGWRGIGMAMKAHQQDWCLRRDIATVTWTFDPLVARNAWFNLAKLGARADAYLIDHYGTMTDGLNAGQASDRLDVRWDVTAGAVGSVPPQAVDPGPDTWVLLADEGDRPVQHPWPSDPDLALLIAVPADVEALRGADPSLARAWRMGLRATLGRGMTQGQRLVGMADHHTYVMRR